MGFLDEFDGRFMWQQGSLIRLPCCHNSQIYRKNMRHSLFTAHNSLRLRSLPIVSVWEYVYSCFEALHTTGANYIVEDIDLYIEARRPSMV